MPDTRPAKAPAVLPLPLAEDPTYHRSGPWWIRLHPGAGAWIWLPGAERATWIEGVDDPDEAVEIIEHERRERAALPGAAAQAPAPTRIGVRPEGTISAAIRASGLLGTVPDGDVARRFGVSVRLVRGLRVEAGLDRVPAERPEARADGLVMDAWGQGLRRDVDIARETGLSEAAVWGARKRLGLEWHPRKRWTAEDFAAVAAYPTAQEAAEGMGLTLLQARSARRRAAAAGYALGGPA